jgi:hypothetical protein
MKVEQISKLTLSQWSTSLRSGTLVIQVRRNASALSGFIKTAGGNTWSTANEPVTIGSWEYILVVFLKRSDGIHALGQSFSVSQHGHVSWGSPLDDADLNVSLGEIRKILRDPTVVDNALQGILALKAATRLMQKKKKVKPNPERKDSTMFEYKLDQWDGKAGTLVVDPMFGMTIVAVLIGMNNKWYGTEERKLGVGTTRVMVLFVNFLNADCVCVQDLQIDDAGQITPGEIIEAENALKMINKYPKHFPPNELNNRIRQAIEVQLASPNVEATASSSDPFAGAEVDPFNGSDPFAQPPPPPPQGTGDTDPFGGATQVEAPEGWDDVEAGSDWPSDGGDSEWNPVADDADTPEAAIVAAVAEAMSEPVRDTKTVMPTTGDEMATKNISLNPQQPIPDDLHRVSSPEETTSATPRGNKRKLTPPPNVEKLDAVVEPRSSGNPDSTFHVSQAPRGGNELPDFREEEVENAFDADSDSGSQVESAVATVGEGDLKAKLDAALEEIKNLKDRKDRVNASNSAKMGALSAENASLRARNAELESQLASAEKQLEERNVKMQELEAKIASHAEVVTATGSTLAEPNPRVAQLEIELESKSSSVDELQKKLDAAEAINKRQAELLESSGTEKQTTENLRELMVSVRHNLRQIGVTLEEDGSVRFDTAIGEIRGSDVKQTLITSGSPDGDHIAGLITEMTKAIESKDAGAVAASVKKGVDLLAELGNENTESPEKMPVKEANPQIRVFRWFPFTWMAPRVSMLRTPKWNRGVVGTIGFAVMMLIWFIRWSLLIAINASIWTLLGFMVFFVFAMNSSKEKLRQDAAKPLQVALQQLDLPVAASTNISDGNAQLIQDLGVAKADIRDLEEQLRIAKAVNNGQVDQVVRDLQSKLKEASGSVATLEKQLRENGAKLDSVQKEFNTANAGLDSIPNLKVAANGTIGCPANAPADATRWLVMSNEKRYGSAANLNERVNVSEGSPTFVNIWFYNGRTYVGVMLVRLVR